MLRIFAFCHLIITVQSDMNLMYNVMLSLGRPLTKFLMADAFDSHFCTMVVTQSNVIVNFMVQYVTMDMTNYLEKLPLPHFAIMRIHYLHHVFAP